MTCYILKSVNGQAIKIAEFVSYEDAHSFCSMCEQAGATYDVLFY